MRCAVVWSSKTGNTELLARSILDVVGQDCVYAGSPCDEALDAERLYVGFWTDKGTCDDAIAAFLSKVGEREVFVFGTAGFGGSSEYFDQILSRVCASIPDCASLVGSYMCQGKMGPSVRRRYEAMRGTGVPDVRVDGLIANFDAALTHPDGDDLEALRSRVLATL